MPAYARSQIVPPDEVGVYHCIARCVRRAFLCGVDPLTKHDYEHRKEWIRERLELLASVFAIDICVADPARQVFVTSRLDRSTASGGESEGRSRPQLAPFWSDWAATRCVFWTCNALSAGGLLTLPDVPPSVCYPSGRLR